MKSTDHFIPTKHRAKKFICNVIKSSQKPYREASTMITKQGETEPWIAKVT